MSLIYFFQQYCEEIFSSASFSSCQNLLDVESFFEACMVDMCNSNSIGSVLCQTIAEFSRECVHAGGKPQQWRNATFCCKCADMYSFSCFAEWFKAHQYSHTKMSVFLQSRHVHTTWSSWSAAVHVLTAAPPLMLARHVTITAMMAAAALLVFTQNLNTVYVIGHTYQPINFLSTFFYCQTLSIIIYHYLHYLCYQCVVRMGIYVFVICGVYHATQNVFTALQNVLQNFNLTVKQYFACHIS